MESLAIYGDIILQENCSYHIFSTWVASKNFGLFISPADAFLADNLQPDCPVSLQPNCRVNLLLHSRCVKCVPAWLPASGIYGHVGRALAMYVQRSQIYS